MARVKACFKCGVQKPLSDFYAHPYMKDGHLNKCKPCFNADGRKRYNEVRHERSKYERERAKRPDRKAKVATYQQARRKRYPEKFVARNAVANALRDGRIVRKPCKVCGNPISQAHHEDYAKPLDVMWLCRAHHQELHGRIVVVAP